MKPIKEIIPIILQEIKNNEELVQYISNFVNAEIKRGNEVTRDTIFNAIEAFERVVK